MFDSADIFTSRRTHFHDCLYWHRSDNELDLEDVSSIVYVDEELDELIYERTPDGSFSAQEWGDYQSENQSIAGSFMYDSHFATISTNDSVRDLSQNDIVTFKGNVWRITSISRKEKKRQNQFSKQTTYQTIINLKR